MGREEVAILIHWAWIIGFFGVMNSCFMLPQLIKVWTEETTQGISLLTIGLLILIQVTFALHGFFIRDKIVMWSNGIAAYVSALVASVVYLRMKPISV